MYKVTDYCNQFNILKFLDDHKKFKEDRDDLQNKLDNIPHLPSKGEDVTGVRSTDKKSLTEALALRRIALEEQIAELDSLLEMYDFAYNKLTEREQDTITLFFSAHRSTPIQRENYCRKYLTNESDMYSKDKPQAVEHFRLIIEEHYRF